MKYFYVSYLFKKGYGSCAFMCSEFFDFKRAKEWLVTQGVDNPVIVNVIKITKKQYEAGT
jgi:hypothetical protein